MAGFSIDGINSGIDTTQYVEAILQFERQPAVLMESDQAEKTNIITAYKALQAKVLALRTEMAKLAKTSTFNASSVDISDDTYINATTTGRTAAGSYDIQVQSLARNHQIASQGFNSRVESIFGTGTIEIAVGDGSFRTITIDASNNSLEGIKKAINDSGADVTANIVNDGSRSNPYRLIVSGNKTGLINEISFTSTLSGGENLNLNTATFDVPEMLSVASGTTAGVSQGAMSAFTGDQNKIYTFTVQGSGAQTVGTDNIIVDWTDGVNSGSIVVTQADTEVELVGAGADGMTLSFSSGVFTAGDTFQVQSFAPLL
ncbi:MAG: hypothetical protein KKA42_17130, partial [candidate division Zixibacteria bacterium]|nr:hypothetical protein [candidate division Zixibacteria bacterium]